MRCHADLIMSLLMLRQLILSLADGISRSLDVFLGRLSALSKVKRLKLLQLSNMLLRRTMQEIGQGLFTKSQHQVLCQLRMMLGEVRESPQSTLRNIRSHTHAHRGGSWEGLLVQPSVDGHFYEVASCYLVHAFSTSEEAVRPFHLCVRCCWCWSALKRSTNYCRSLEVIRATNFLLKRVFHLLHAKIIQLLVCGE